MSISIKLFFFFKQKLILGLKELSDLSGDRTVGGLWLLKKAAGPMGQELELWVKENTSAQTKSQEAEELGAPGSTPSHTHSHDSKVISAPPAVHCSLGSQTQIFQNSESCIQVACKLISFSQTDHKLHDDRNFCLVTHCLELYLSNN